MPVSRLILLLLLLLPSLPGLAETLTGLSVESRLLGRRIPYTLHRPDGAGDGPFPVFYLLHGHGGGERDWLGVGGLEQAIAKDPDLAPMLVVMPGFGNSWYVDSKAFGPVEQAFFREFLPEVESRWHGDPGRRAIGGLSMGGFGALHLSLRRPGSFTAVAALSPAILTPDAPVGPLQLRFFGKAFGSPFDRSRFEAANPFELLRALPEGTRLPAFYLMSGDDDEFGLEIGTIRFYLALRSLGVRPELRIRDGGHRWPLWRRELPSVLSFVSRRWGAGRTARLPER